MDDLLPIGRFSKATRLSVKALRHYDELGLLRPALVDPSSGYRYYRPAQANQAEAIRILRSVEMPLEEIGELLADGGGEPAAKRLHRHRERLEARLAEHRRMLAFLQRLLEREDVMPYEVTVKELPAQPVAATRTTSNLREISSAISDGVHAILAELGAPGDRAGRAAPGRLPRHRGAGLRDQRPDRDLLPGGGPVPRGPARSTGPSWPAARPPSPSTAAPTPRSAPPTTPSPAGCRTTATSWPAAPARSTSTTPREVAEADLQTEVQWPIR